MPWNKAAQFGIEFCDILLNLPSCKTIMLGDVLLLYNHSEISKQLFYSIILLKAMHWMLPLWQIFVVSKVPMWKSLPSGRGLSALITIILLGLLKWTKQIAKDRGAVVLEEIREGIASNTSLKVLHVSKLTFPSSSLFHLLLLQVSRITNGFLQPLLVALKAHSSLSKLTLQVSL